MSLVGEGGLTVTVAEEAAAPLLTDSLMFSVTGAAPEMSVGALRVPTEHAALLQVTSGVQLNEVAPEADAALASTVMLAPDCTVSVVLVFGWPLTVKVAFNAGFGPHWAGVLAARSGHGVSWPL